MREKYHLGYFHAPENITYLADKTKLSITCDAYIRNCFCMERR